MLTEKQKNITVRARDIFGAYAKEVRKNAGLFSLVLLGSMVVQATSLASPVFLKELFNLIAAGHPAPELMRGLFTLVGIIAGISIIGWIGYRLQFFCLVFFEVRSMANLYDASFYYLIRHSYHFFVSQFSGTLTRRVSKYSASFETIVDGIMMGFLPTFFFATGAVIILFIRNHILGIALGVWVICFVAFQIFVARLRQPLRVARSEADSKMTGSLSDAIANQNTISLFSGNRHEQDIFRKIVKIWQKATLRSWVADETIWSIQGILMTGINIGLLYGAVVYWQKGLVSIGDFVLIQSYLIGLFNQLMNINIQIRRFYDAYADAVEMATILKTPHEVHDIPDAVPLSPKNCEIVFKDVHFRFPHHKPILQNFNLTVKAGEKLALVGPSGAGKTTVTKLLLRLYDITGGSIEIDGQNIAKVTQESLRNTIAFVPQEPILFHRTLMENIRYGRRDASDAEVIEAAKKAHCHEFISRLPEGYETFVGERGVKLSGGERQRVAIARAILKDAPILVLDEATSSLDSESEALIQEALQTLMRGKTVIVIAHRLSTIMKMDRIVVIENGAVVSEGTHRELLKKDGLYKKLWGIQAGGFLEEKTAESK